MLLILLTWVTVRLLTALFLFGLMEQIKSSLIPLRKFLDKIAYNKGFTPELKYDARKVSGVNSALKFESPL